MQAELNSITQFFISSKKFKNFVSSRKSSKSRMMLPSDINAGECYRWTYFVSLCIENCQLFRTIGDTYTHAFISIEDKFYDAECLGGVIDWKQLPFFILTSKRPWCQEWEDDAIIKDEKDEFIKYWKFDPVYVEERVKEYEQSESLPKIN